MIKIQDMEEEPELKNLVVNLMPRTQLVTIQSPHPPTEQAPREEEEIIPLDDDPVMDMYELNYDEIQKKIVEATLFFFSSYNLVSHASIKKRVIGTNTKRNPGAIFIAKLAFASATKSNIDYLVSENKQLEKKLQDARKEGEQLWAELQNVTPTQVYL